jgi:hypothetical protein
MLEAHALEDDPMYTTEYDLLVARDHYAEMRNEMDAIRMAQAIQAKSHHRPSLLDWVMLLTSRVQPAPAPQRHVGAAI